MGHRPRGRRRRLQPQQDRIGRHRHPPVQPGGFTAHPGDGRAATSTYKVRSVAASATPGTAYSCSPPAASPSAASTPALTRRSAMPSGRTPASAGPSAAASNTRSPTIGRSAPNTVTRSTAIYCLRQQCLRDGAIGGFANAKFEENRVTVGFSYKFDMAAPAPVVAKY